MDLEKLNNPGSILQLKIPGDQVAEELNTDSPTGPIVEYNGAGNDVEIVLNGIFAGYNDPTPRNTHIIVQETMRCQWLHPQHDHIPCLLPRKNKYVLVGAIDSEDIYIASWRDDGGNRKIGCVGTIEAARKFFIDQMGDDCTSFAPYVAWPPDEIGQIHENFEHPECATVQIFALVTPSDKFYSLLVFHIAGDREQYVVGGIKEAVSLDYGQLANNLMEQR